MCSACIRRGPPKHLGCIQPKLAKRNGCHRTSSKVLCPRMLAGASFGRAEHRGSGGDRPHDAGPRHPHASARRGCQVARRGPAGFCPVTAATGPRRASPPRTSPPRRGGTRGVSTAAVCRAASTPTARRPAPSTAIRTPRPRLRGMARSASKPPERRSPCSTRSGPRRGPRRSSGPRCPGHAPRVLAPSYQPP
jgi:hypothetical protein